MAHFKKLSKSELCLRNVSSEEAEAEHNAAPDPDPELCQKFWHLATIKKINFRSDTFHYNPQLFDGNCFRS